VAPRQPSEGGDFQESADAYGVQKRKPNTGVMCCPLENPFYGNFLYVLSTQPCGLDWQDSHRYSMELSFEEVACPDEKWIRCLPAASNSKQRGVWCSPQLKNWQSLARSSLRTRK